MLKIILSILFAFLVIFIISLNINSDYDTYLQMFEDFNSMSDFYNFLNVIKNNTLIVYFLNLITSNLGFDEVFSTNILFFLQALIHSLIIFNLSGIKYGSIILFSDLQQIDLNQVRYGLALSFMTIASRRILLSTKIKNKLFFRSKNFILIIFGFLLHFQSVFIIFISYLSKLKTRYSIIISTTIIISIPLLLNISGITKRYLNVPYDMESYLSLNIFLYLPIIYLVLLWFSQIEGDKLNTLRFEKIKIHFGRKSIYKFFAPTLIFITGFFIISNSPAYEGRIITGLYSALMYLVAIRLDLQKTKYDNKNTAPYLPNFLIIPFLLIGFYRLLVLQGNIYRFI